jgi:hypothetical protein
MRKLLLHLDSSPHPSSFDQVVAYDAGADAVMAYGNVTDSAVRELVHGCLFTRGLKDLRHTACFIGGTDVQAADRLLHAARDAFFGPFRMSILFDPNGSNTTAVAAVEKIRAAIGDLSGRRALVLAGTGPVGTRVAGLLARAGADVTISSRSSAHGEEARTAIQSRFGEAVSVSTGDAVRSALDDTEVLCNCGPAGIRLLSAGEWSARETLRVVVDLNAVPPSGIEGVEPTDDAARRDGAVVFGALGVGGLKMKIHKACVASLFERNDLVLDAESIAELARDLAAEGTRSA